MLSTLVTLSGILAVSIAAGAVQSVPEAMPPALATYYVALYDAGPAWAQGQPPLAQPGIQAHGEYMDELSRRGHLVLGGPLMKDIERADLAGALLVIKADSIEEARTLVAADPALKAGVMRLRELRHFLVYVGGVADQPEATE